MKKLPNSPVLLIKALGLCAIVSLTLTQASIAIRDPNGTSLSAMTKHFQDSHPHAKAAAMGDQLQQDSDQGNPSSMGDIVMGGTSSGSGGGGSPVQAGTPQTQAQASQPCKSCKNEPQFNMAGWTENKKPGPLDHPGPPTAGDQVFRFTPGSKTDEKDTFKSNYMAEGFFGGQDTKPFQGFGGPLTDTGFYAAAKQISDRKTQMMQDPQNHLPAASAKSQAQQQCASEAAGDAGEAAFDQGIIAIRQTLVNVANEGAGIPCSAHQPFKLIENAVWMVQQMYKHVYLPMAILLLLPGAVLTHVKGMISFGILSSQDEDGVSPFTGILRAMIAIFLIPATQLIVSYATDIGNSLTYEVQKHIVPAELMAWAHQQTFAAPMENARNIIQKPPQMLLQTPFNFLTMEGAIPGMPNPMIAGIATNGPEQISEVEQQSAMTQTMQMFFNIMNMAFGIGIMILLAFQTVMMCYLLLMGPIAAAFFAWPTGVGSLFNKIFANWVDAVTNLALWRFWWCIVLLCMTTRISWLREMGAYTPNSQWEMLMYTAFMVILTYVPFMPFDFKPGEMASKMLEKASKAAEGGKGGGGGGGGGEGGGGGGGGNDEAAPKNDTDGGGGGNDQNQPAPAPAPPGGGAARGISSMAMSPASGKSSGGSSGSGGGGGGSGSSSGDNADGNFSDDEDDEQYAQSPPPMEGQGDDPDDDNSYGSDPPPRYT